VTQLADCELCGPSHRDAFGANIAGAHRAHIALAELGVPFEEVIIDLDTPRTAEYLAVNPRGQVPTLSYNGDIIVESGIVANFLADQYPSHLVPESSAPGGALRRAQIAVFVDAFVSKFQGHLFKFFSAAESEHEALVETAVAALVKEVEPRLKDASPYFGGSDKLTLAEVSLTQLGVDSVVTNS
jgi:glutathione S-transferase